MPWISMKRLRVPMLAALLILAAMAGVEADDRQDHAVDSAKRTETLRRVKETQRRLLLEKARLRMQKARAEAKTKKLAAQSVAQNTTQTTTKTGAKPGAHQRPAPRIDDVMPFSKEHVARMARDLESFGTSALAPNLLANDTTDNQLTGAGQAEQMIAAWGPYVLAAWNDGQGFEEGPAADLQGFGYSTDYGATFQDGGDIPSPAGAQWTSDPVVAVNEKTGEFYFLALIAPTSTTNGIGIVRGTFSGTTFTWDTPFVIVSGSNTTVFYDKPWAVADSSSGRLYLTYTRFFAAANVIEFRRTTGAWNMWSSPTAVNATASNGLVQGSRPAVGPGGEVYVTWKEIGPIDKDYIRIRRSTNQGSSFGSIGDAAEVFDNFGTGAPGFNRERGITFPAIAVDRSNGSNRGRVYVAWNECINWYKDLGPIGTGGNRNESEPNDAFGNADPFTIGETLNGAFSSIADVDFFSFSATQGTTYTFWCDTIPNSLYSMRVFCTDQVTRLNLAGDLLSPAENQNGFITWTCPANGTYYLRMFANIPGSAAGIYRILTGVNTTGPEPGRDQRDIMVTSAPNGIGFGAPVRVNVDPPWFDNWLPEVAVAADGSVYAFWYGWHEATPSACGGESHCYLARSVDGGASWIQTGRVTETLSQWTFGFTNIQPNQGDYLGLYANETVYAAWADNRNGNADTYVSVLPSSITPVLVALASADALPDRVTVTWYAASPQVTEAYVYRLEDGEWLLKSAVTRDGSDHLVYVDQDVKPGKRYSYRLGVRDGATEVFLGEVTVVVPSRFALRIDSVRPNPTDRDVWVSFTLPENRHATLSMWDVAGRRVRMREVGTLGLGRHVLDLTAGEPLAAGVYLVRLEQAGRVAVGRVSVVR